VRQVPPLVRCWILTGRRSRSAWLLVKDGEVDHEAQDHVLLVAEAPGQCGGVLGQ
jgi:hypothetical protein